jgi:hypothetical protein
LGTDIGTGHMMKHGISLEPIGTANRTDRFVAFTLEAAESKIQLASLDGLMVPASNCSMSNMCPPRPLEILHAASSLHPSKSQTVPKGDNRG